MPIYDNDGTANREIGKLYDNNGSVNTPIGKVYDNNGSANTLIYSAETQLYPGTAASARMVNAGSWGSFWTQINQAGTNINSSMVYIGFNATNYNTIQVTGNLITHGTWGGAGIYLLNTSQFNDYNIASYPFYVVSVGGPQGANRCVYHHKVNAGGLWDGTLSWSLSGLSGTYYICCGAYLQSYDGGDGQQRAEIYSVILKE